MKRVAAIDGVFARAFYDAPMATVMADVATSSLGRVFAANQKLRELTGHEERDAVGRNLVEFLTGEDRDTPLRELERLVMGELPAWRLEREIRRADGRWIWAQIDVWLVRDESGAPGWLMAQFQDIGESRRAARAMEARAAMVRVLAQAETLQGAISSLVPALGSALRFELAIAWELDADGAELHCTSLWQSDDVDCRSLAAVSRELPLSRGVGLPGRAWQSGQAAISPDLGRESGCPRAPAAKRDGVHAAAALPIFIGSDFHGSLEFARVGDRNVDAELLDLLSELSDDLAGLLARKRPQETRTESRELLLVEDNMFIARLVGEMVAVCDLELDLVHVDRLSAARDRLLCSRPACLLLDLTLPDADGLEALLEVRKLAPELPIVVLTGLEDENLAVRAVQEGAQDYLMKRKVDLHGLARAIRYAIERKGAEQLLLDHRLRDRLTQLPNRVLFLDRLRVALTRAGRGSVGVLLLNLDRFRLLNDSLGHETGDRLLLEAADRLVKVLRADTTIASFGGDQFAVLLESADERSAASLAQRLREVLSAPFLAGDDAILLTATVGVALDDGGMDAESLLGQADTALSRGKDLGGDRSEVFEEAVRERLRERFNVETGLRRAIETGELRVFYQPLVSLSAGEIAGFEALVRWEHPERGLMSPRDFMPVAEESGLVVPLGAAVLEEAVAQLAAWHTAFPHRRTLRVNVNLSARQLADPALVQTVRNALGRSGVDPDSVCLEVTETAIIESLERSLQTLRALKALGISLALDDFGTGYSSLSYLQRFPIDVLKLDRSFVAALRTEGRSAIVGAVANMAGALGLPALAEGIEEEHEVDELRSLGYALGQGYAFGRPMPPEDAARLLLTPARGTGLLA